LEAFGPTCSLYKVCPAWKSDSREEVGKAKDKGIRDLFRELAKEDGTDGQVPQKLSEALKKLANEHDVSSQLRVNIGRQERVDLKLWPICPYNNSQAK